MLKKSLTIIALTAGLFLGRDNFCLANNNPNLEQRVKQENQQIYEEDIKNILSQMPNSKENLKILEQAEEIKITGNILIIKTPKTTYALNIPSIKDYINSEKTTSNSNHHKEENNTVDRFVDRFIIPDEYLDLVSKADSYSKVPGMEDEAKELYIKAAQVSESKEKYGLAANSYENIGMEDKAKEMHLKSAQRDESEEYYASAAWSYEKVGMEDKAKEMYLKSAQKNESERLYLFAADDYSKIPGMEDKTKEMQLKYAQKVESQGLYWAAAEAYKEAGMEDKAKEMRLKDAQRNESEK